MSPRGTLELPNVVYQTTFGTHKVPLLRHCAKLQPMSRLPSLPVSPARTDSPQRLVSLPTAWLPSNLGDSPRRVSRVSVHPHWLRAYRSMFAHPQLTLRSLLDFQILALRAVLARLH
jgi:hypothetical protein